jgi:TatD DNase family protein
VRWTDNHCHLVPGPEATDAIAAAAAAGVERLVVVGTDAEQSREALRVARAHEGVWATAGVHPHDATEGVEGILDLLDERRVVAVGECGLDFHYDHSPRSVQRAVFAQQIQLANQRSLPLVIHTREAWDETFEILAHEGPPARTVFHCFTGGESEARRALEIGASLSFSGIVTFPNADDVRAAAATCPPDRLLVETDSPYLTPVPHRGQRNRPELVPLVGEAVARARGVPVAEVAEATWTNAERFYGLA